jgi:hypothetical protein
MSKNEHNLINLDIRINLLVSAEVFMQAASIRTQVGLVVGFLAVFLVVVVVVVVVDFLHLKTSCEDLLEDLVECLVNPWGRISVQEYIFLF